MTKLSLETKFENHSVTFNNIDVSLDQLFNAFKGQLVAIGWDEIQINDYIIEIANELKSE
jgi:hypothetical protein